MRAPWWRSFSVERDSSFFFDDVHYIQEAQRHPTRAELLEIRALLDTGELLGEQPEPAFGAKAEPVALLPKSFGERFLWAFITVLVVWFWWAVLSAPEPSVTKPTAALSAPAP